jgi:hypothetical protein
LLGIMKGNFLKGKCENKFHFLDPLLYFHRKQLLHNVSVKLYVIRAAWI